MKDNKILNSLEIDALGEVMNISLGSSATSLSELLGKRVDITVPRVDVVEAGDFRFDSLEPAIGIEIKYTEGLEGVNLLILKREDAKSVVEILMGMELPEFEMDEINASALCEVMNQMMGSASTALANFLSRTINISTPIAYEIENRDKFREKYFTENNKIVTVSFNLDIDGVVHSEFINVLSFDLCRDILSVMIPSEEEVIEEVREDVEEADTTEEVIKEKVVKKPKEEEVVKKTMKKQTNKEEVKEPVNVRNVEIQSFDDEDELDYMPQEQRKNLDLIMSVPLEVSVEIGSTKRQIKDILEFKQGTIVELDKQAGALVDIIVNGKLIAKGEVVVVNDNFGVRVVEIVKKDKLMEITA